MSIEKLRTEGGKESCWAEALVCSCVARFGRPEPEKIAKRIDGEIIINGYGERCHHRCGNFAREPWGLCGFHTAWYADEVFEAPHLPIQRHSPSEQRELVAA